ncbi:uncharacterized protein LOC124926900 isoform X2 [Impatiens glandulifera]|nr:uncharacterized protein LOC124926900 isoform X2 [Impatiens glandulifera]
MPPWVGKPSMIRVLPESSRYICIACCFVDTFSSFDNQLHDNSSRADVCMDKDSQCGKSGKCAVIIVDSYTLTIVQTVFHGNLSIGSLRFMDVIPPLEDTDSQLVVMVDLLGKLQCFTVEKDSREGENETSMQKGSTLELTHSVESLSERVQVLAFAAQGQIIALVYRAHCTFKLLTGEITIGEISFADNQLCLEDGPTQVHIAGCMFLEQNQMKESLNSIDSQNASTHEFVVWNDRGFANVYRITYSDSVFKFKLISLIPATSYPRDARVSICFSQLNQFLLRIESISYAECSSVSKPHITAWLVPRRYDHSEHLFVESILIGQSRSFVECIPNLNPGKVECHDSGSEVRVGKTLLSTQQDLILNDADDNIKGNRDILFSRKRYHVSSSMVISEGYIPSAILYGLSNGDIELVHLDTFIGSPEYHCKNSTCEDKVDSNASKQYLLGHTDAVLCLAMHVMFGTARGWSFSRVLLSGSLDCTVRIWDLDSGNPIMVLHHHVSPVRQIILAPFQTDHPWSDCFLSIGDDMCIALVSLETLRVERMFPGHPYYPAKILWDGQRGYLACLCQYHSGASDAHDVLYIWDIKTGACERVLRGTSSHSMFDHFGKGINNICLTDGYLNGNTSASSFLHIFEDPHFPQSHVKDVGKGAYPLGTFSGRESIPKSSDNKKHGKGDLSQLSPQRNKLPIKSSTPFPGIAALSFDLEALMSSCKRDGIFKDKGHENAHVKEQKTGKHPSIDDNNRNVVGMKEEIIGMPSTHEAHVERFKDDCSDSHIPSLEYLLQFTMSFLHFWDVDEELDELLVSDMKLKKPDFLLAAALPGDRGSLTVTFPNSNATVELLRSSSEFSAMRSLTMVSLAQHMVSLSHSFSVASSALAAFYTRNLMEKFTDIKPPLLQLLVSFWQDKSEHTRMAARTLFHCAASKAIPPPLRSCKLNAHEQPLNDGVMEHESVETEEAIKNGSLFDSIEQKKSMTEESEIVTWLESFEAQDWIFCVGGTSQDAMTAHIIVAAALAIWYPSLVKPSLASLVIHPLMKLVMAMNDKYSSAAAELLGEGMESTWKACISSEIHRLIGDIFFQIECVSGVPANVSAPNPVASLSIRETLVEFLLPSLALADVPGFLNVIESQIWSTASDSPVHAISLMTLIRVIHNSPRSLTQYLDKAVSFILHTMDPSNSVMRRICFQSSKVALKEIVSAFPMVVLNESSTRLAVGDAFGEINNATIRIYDMQSVSKVKILDASAPPGFPSLLGGAQDMSAVSAISALSFSPDGEGLVAFSEHGLMIRWWSLGSIWWEKLSRNFVPVQCTKMIFVPPWEGFSPKAATRTSIMASVMPRDGQASPKEIKGGLCDTDQLKHLILNLDLSYRLEWVGSRKVVLKMHDQELGAFQLL